VRRVDGRRAAAGSGALAGSGFPFDREPSQRTRFAAITRNSMDVSGDRDFALDFLYAERNDDPPQPSGEDWILYSSEEFACSNWDGVTTAQSHAAEEEPGFAGADSRKVRPVMARSRR